MDAVERAREFAHQCLEAHALLASQLANCDDAVERLDLEPLVAAAATQAEQAVLAAKAAETEQKAS